MILYEKARMVFLKVLMVFVHYIRVNLVSIDFGPVVQEEVFHI